MFYLYCKFLTEKLTQANQPVAIDYFSWFQLQISGKKEKRLSYFLKTTPSFCHYFVNVTIKHPIIRDFQRTRARPYNCGDTGTQNRSMLVLPPKSYGAESGGDSWKERVLLPGSLCHDCFIKKVWLSFGLEAFSAFVWNISMQACFLPPGYYLYVSDTHKK